MEVRATALVANPTRDADMPVHVQVGSQFITVSRESLNDGEDTIPGLFENFTKSAGAHHARAGRVVSATLPPRRSAPRSISTDLASNARSVFDSELAVLSCRHTSILSSIVLFQPGSIEAVQPELQPGGDLVALNGREFFQNGADSIPVGPGTPVSFCRLPIRVLCD